MKKWQKGTPMYISGVVMVYMINFLMGSPAPSRESRKDLSLRQNASDVRIASRYCGSENKYARRRIVGGFGTKPHEYPFYVLLEVLDVLSRGSYVCGGSLIHPRWVLTAAHCVVNADDVLIAVSAGLHHSGLIAGDATTPLEPAENCQRVLVTRAVQHENYTWGRHENDIALLELFHNVQLSADVKVACLASPGTMFSGRRGIVTGYGRDAFRTGHLQGTLQAVELDVLDSNVCKYLFLNVVNAHVSERMFCAYASNKDSCQGDSGGPFLREVSNGRFVQTGIVSFGIRCATRSYPGVYTCVAGYLTWIQHVTNVDGLCIC